MKRKQDASERLFFIKIAKCFKANTEKRKNNTNEAYFYGKSDCCIFEPFIFIAKKSVREKLSMASS